MKDVRREEKKKSLLFEKGRHIFRQFSVIKPLENNSSNRYIILPVTGGEERVRSTVHYAVFSLQGIGNISLCGSAVLHYRLMNEFRGGRTNTDTHTETQTTGAFLWDQTGRQRSSWRSVLGYERLPNSQCGRSSTVRSLTFLAFYGGQESPWTHRISCIWPCVFASSDCYIIVMDQDMKPDCGF